MVGIDHWPAAQNTGTLRAWTASRRDKIAVGGLALLSASVIAVNPVASSAPELLDIQHRAVSLAAAVDITSPPVDLYAGVVSNTVNSITGLASSWLANPFPLLSQVVENQVGYAERLGSAVWSMPASLEKWWTVGGGESKAGSFYLSSMVSALQAGDFNAAYNNFNSLLLFGMQQLAQPIYNVFLSSTSRQTGELTLGVVQQMAQNFADAVGVLFNTSTVIFAGFQSVFAPVSGAAYAASQAINAITSAASLGDVQGALTALVNTPGVVADAFLNGFDYDGADGSTNPWAGFLSPKDPNCEGRCAGGGPIYQLFVGIPTAIAQAIANVTAAAPTTATASTISLAAAEDTTTVSDDTAAAIEASPVSSTETSESATPVATDATDTVVADDVAADTTETVTDTTETVTDTTEAATDGTAVSTKPATDTTEASTDTDAPSKGATSEGASSTTPSKHTKSDSAAESSTKPAGKHDSSTSSKPSKSTGGSDSSAGASQSEGKKPSADKKQSEGKKPSADKKSEKSNSSDS